MTVNYEDLTAEQQEGRTTRYEDLPAAQQQLVERIMAETEGDGRYRVCVAEISESERVTLGIFAQRARERYDPDVGNLVYLAYEGEVYSIAVRVEDVIYAR